MRKNLVIIFLIIQSLAYGQEDTSFIEEVIILPNEIVTKDTSVLNGVFIDDTEFFVSYPGGERKLKKYLTDNINFKKLKNVQNSKIIVVFSVDEKGNVGDVKIKGLEHDELVAELSQVFLNMKRWRWDKKLNKRERKKTIKAITIRLD